MRSIYIKRHIYLNIKLEQYSAEAKNERSNRAQRVFHLKNQNRVGATAIAQFMDKNIHICAGRTGELDTAADKAASVVSQMYCKFLALDVQNKMTCQWVCASSSLSFKYFELPMSQEHMQGRNPCPLFCNFATQQLVDSSSKSWLCTMTGLQTLFGLISPRVTGTDLNDACDLLQTLLARKPDRSCALVIAPYLTSQTAPEQSGPHSEKRTDRAGQNNEVSIFDVFKILLMDHK